MGGDSSKPKEAIAVAPAPLDDPEDTKPETEEEAGAVAQILPTAANYPAFVDAVGAAGSDAHQASAQWLNSLSNEELQQLATENGFQHPELVGANAQPGSHPLAHWLDPTYPDSPGKAKIQAKANERHTLLAAGEPVPGYEHLAITPDPGPAEWEASPTELAGLMADITTRSAELKMMMSSSERLEKLGDLVTAENKVVTASCAEMTDAQLAKLKASATLAVDNSTVSTFFPPADATFGLPSPVPADQIDVLTIPEQITAARKSQDQQSMVDLAAARSHWLGIRTKHHDTMVALKTGSTPFPSTPTQLAETLQDVADYHQAHYWLKENLPYHSKFNPHSNHAPVPKDFRAWAKSQPLSDLRTTAELQGLEHANKANRTQVTNYLLAGWSKDPKAETADIQNSVTAKAAAPKPSPKSSPKSKATSKATKKPKLLPTTGFGGKLAALKAKVQSHKALQADLPPALPESLVSTHSWANPTPFSKGSHESKLYTGPDGEKWMFKPDKSANGARAHAESAATKIFKRVGVPGVVAHPVNISGKTGAIQPLVSDATNLTGSPSNWTQQDVDAIVGLHVAAWAVGDHDGHSSNVMRSKSGGLFAVDQGQAFKFYGTDKLAPGWAPTTNFGTPVYHEVYSAHTNNSLAPGVQLNAKAAMPVLKAFETVSDNEYRSMLASTATEGVKNNVHWVPAMRKDAAGRLGKPANKVTDTEIADEFLHHAVERKNNLRKSFASMFTKLGVHDAPHLEWVR